MVTAPPRRPAPAALPARSGGDAVHETPSEEALRALQLEPGHTHVRPRTSVQGLLSGGESIEQREGRVARHQLIIPLQQELDRDRDSGRCLCDRLITGETEDGSVDPGFGCTQRNADPATQRHAPGAHWRAAVRPGLPAHSGTDRAARSAWSSAMYELIGSPVATRCLMPAASCSSWVVLGRSAVPGRVDGSQGKAGGSHGREGREHPTCYSVDGSHLLRSVTCVIVDLRPSRRHRRCVPAGGSPMRDGAGLGYSRRARDHGFPGCLNEEECL